MHSKLWFFLVLFLFSVITPINAQEVIEPGRWTSGEMQSLGHGNVTVDFVVSEDGKQAEITWLFTDFSLCGSSAGSSTVEGLTGDIEDGSFFQAFTFPLDEEEYEVGATFTSPTTAEGTLTYKRQECEIVFFWDASLIIDEETGEETEVAPSTSTISVQPGSWSSGEMNSEAHGTIRVNFAVSDDGEQAEVEIPFTDFAGCGVTTTGTMTVLQTADIADNALSLEWTDSISGAEYEVMMTFTSPATAIGSLVYRWQQCEITFLWNALPATETDTASVVPTSGDWTSTELPSGDTEAVSVDFTVQENGEQVTSFTISGENLGGCGITGVEGSGMSIELSASVEVVQGTFLITNRMDFLNLDMELQGTFVSPTQAEGTFKFICEDEEIVWEWASTVSENEAGDTATATGVPQAGQWTGSGSGDFTETVIFTVTQEGIITDLVFQVEGAFGGCTLTFSEVEINPDGAFTVDTDPNSILDTAATIEGTFDSETNLSGTYSNPLLCDNTIFGVLVDEDRTWTATWQE